MTTDSAVDEAQIRRILDARIQAIRNKDVDAATSLFSPDILSFDVVNPLQSTGSEAARKRAEDWFSSLRGSIGYEMRDLTITAGVDVGFSHGLSHVRAATVDGGQLDMWWRTTICFRKIGGEWIATHQHDSVPFDVQSGRASLDLKP
jgi:ketosteroid isomerase-like protein